MKPMCMKAIGTLNSDRSYYILVKESLIEKPLNEIMEKIGHDVLFYGKDEGDDFTEYENRVERIVSGKYDIDVVYTSNRVILIVRAPEKEQKIFRELMFAYSKMGG